VAQPPSAVAREELARRLSTRRDELARLAALKTRLIAKINGTRPPLRRSTLSITGMNADLIGADDKGITAKLPDGKAELHEWTALNARSVKALVQLAIDKASADDWLAAGLLILTRVAQPPSAVSSGIRTPALIRGRSLPRRKPSTRPAG